MKIIQKRHKYIFLPIISIIMIACFSCSNKVKVDLIVKNAKVYTVDSIMTISESFAVKDGKFVAIGTNDYISGNYESEKIVDGEGKFIYPGLIDAHCHFWGYGLNLQNADLTATKSFDEIIDILKEHNVKYNPEWLVGRGWDQNDWEVKDFPDNHLLDSLFPDKPVVLIRIDGHAVIINSEALKRANLNFDDFQKEEIIYKDGKFTGVLLENAADAAKDGIPEKSYDEKVRALLDAQKNCFAVGLTTVVDAGTDIPWIDLIDSLQKAGELKMRVYAMLPYALAHLDKLKQGKYKTEYLSVRSVKLYADGALGSRGAKLIKPYSDDSTKSGVFVKTYEEQLAECQAAYDAGFQVCTHAIGDSAVRFMLDIYSSILKGKNDLRWRIEHSQVVHPDDFDKYGKYNIIPSIQSTHATSDMYWAESRVGPKRIKGAYAYQQLLQQNGWLPNGSDFPIESINPLFGFYAGVSRKDQSGYPENGFQAENDLTREQALKAMTIWAAKSCFEENEKGSIEVGKFADFVILEKDLMTEAENELFKIKVLETYLGGEKVY
ncbi:MAG: amidohydrolase [Saprospiraceae bacterium]|nr:amidohydrolase [Saprospiraceae bacterium]